MSTKAEKLRNAIDEVYVGLKPLPPPLWCRVIGEAVQRQIEMDHELLLSMGIRMRRVAT